MPLKQIKYSCIVDTPYSLLLYLLMSRDGDWGRTIYFVGDGIDKSIMQKLQRVVYFPSNDFNKYNTTFRRLCIKLRAMYWRACYVNRTKIFAHDHLAYSAQIIGKNNYVLIEDAPGAYTMCGSSLRHNQVEPIPRGLRARIKRVIEWGPIYGLHFGRNTQCIDRWVTEHQDLRTPVLEGKRCQLLDINELWKNASDEKRHSIMEIFSICEKDLEDWKSCDTIIFTDPFAEFGLNEEDSISIFVPFVRKFKSERIIIKPHPRDHIDWKFHFPSAVIINAEIPMQLLNLIGVNFRRAITVFSTAISAMDKDTELYWLGVSAHPKLERYCRREVECPFKKKFSVIKNSL